MGPSGELPSQSSRIMATRAVNAGASRKNQVSVTRTVSTNSFHSLVEEWRSWLYASAFRSPRILIRERAARWMAVGPRALGSRPMTSRSDCSISIMRDRGRVREERPAKWFRQQPILPHPLDGSFVVEQHRAQIGGGLDLQTGIGEFLSVLTKHPGGVFSNQAQQVGVVVFVGIIDDNDAGAEQVAAGGS